jgi:hypothetical protein
MKSGILSILVLISTFAAYSQVDTREMKEHVTLKFLPLGLFDFDNTVQVGVEVPFSNNRFSFQQEVGYGHSSFNIWYHEDGRHPDKSTIKTRTQLRFYFYEKRRARSYVAGEFLYKRVINRQSQWVGQNCIYGDCDYLEYKDVRFGRFVNAVHVKVGWQFYFSNRMTLDLYTGFGVRDIRGRTLTPNAGNATMTDDWFIWNNRRGTYREVFPSVTPGFQIGFSLGKFAGAKSSDSGY